jgi:hypothetical protein
MDWKKTLSSEFGDSVRLSENLAIEDADGVVSLTMDARFSGANMQQDAAAFETWALALKVAGARKVILRWNDINQTGAHSCRFSYRVERFSQLFGAWFKANPLPSTEIPSQPNGADPQFFLNEESQPRSGGPDGASGAQTLDLRASEHDLELALAGDHPASATLKKVLGLKSVHRQLPVGVFKGRVAKSASVFTGGRSAIDLWGLGGDKGLFLFELKNARNKKLGALAELFFYSMVMHDLQRGVLGLGRTTAKAERPYHAITKTKTIDAYILAPNFHPLIEKKDAAVLKLFNEAFASSKIPIRFGLARLLAQAPFVEIVNQA